MKRQEKFIISSPANICGVYHSKDFSVDHMFKSEKNDRNFFVLQITNLGDLDVNFKKKKNTGITKIIRSYDRIIEKDILTLFSIFFGKCFEFHGILESGGIYHKPNFQNNEIKHQLLPTNNHNERIDKYIDMNWTNIGAILETLDNPKISIFLKAGEFYKKALININYDPEIAYIDLIRCIEILSVSISDESDTENLFNGSLKKIYNKIKDDKKLSDLFIKYNGSTKRFCNTILKLVPINNGFWTRSESNRIDFGFLYLKQDRNKIIKILERTYTIRNKYIHEGLNFESFIVPNKEGLNELVHIQPGNNLDETIKIRDNLSFSGLERITRCCLLNFLQNL